MKCLELTIERGRVLDQILAPVAEHHALIGADAAQAHRQPGAERERQHGDRSSRDRHDSRRAGEIVHRLQG